ncbi:MAG TPA: prephenate dehydratase [Fibrobacteria bacterium]|nr:prephenate dehydratase [Fibrobacteria bacterium]
MLIAYQGVPGAYSEMASRRLFPDGTTLPCETFEDVFAAVEKKRADCGVVPVENSLAGSIHQNYDLLVAHKLKIVGETYVRVQHALMALPGTKLSAVQAVRSHPQALAQCSAFFAEHPRVRQIIWYDTAGAARSLAEARAADPASVKGVAAIASEAAAEIYGLKVLKKRLQNRALNFTRFLAITRSGARVTVAPLATGAPVETKTSLTFIPARNRAGVLHAITGVFAAHDVDLTKIESRPDPENAFDYRFHLDAVTGPADPAFRKIVAALKPLTRDLRVLGSYERARLPLKG